ncbi:Uncharacterized protein DBV15_07152 [Temnothorax longispinosus]|uniref:Uncharacterized protein n=1 Tax=Temnothorax longispinosus TaxID=300112 RepID=A0A4S2KL49_9HYME|nr:Uncharacterized protein DBV15_07152 [Temnothorax longispinosus]
MHTLPSSSPIRFRMTRGLSKRSLIESSAQTSFSPCSTAEATHSSRAWCAQQWQRRVRLLLLPRARRYLPTYSTARRTGGCKWYIHYYPQSNGWNLLGDKLLRPPTLLAEFRDSIRAEAERDTF